MSQAVVTDDSPHNLRVDFSWGKFSYRFYNAQTHKHILTAKFNWLAPHMEFLDTDTKAIIATGTFHNFSIHADCTVGSRSFRLKAQKRFKTKYSYLSHAYSDDVHNPVIITLTTNTSTSKWDFVLVDENLEAVARYSTNIWALKKIGMIEFVGPKAGSKAVRDEVMVVVGTIYCCMTGMLI